MRRKRYKSLLLCWIAGPLPIGVVLLRRCGDKRDGLSAHEYVLANVPLSSGVRVLWLGIASGWCPVGWCFPGCQNCFNQEDALGAPCLDTVILALRRRALAGRRNAADRRHPSLRCHITVCYTGHQAGKR